VHIGLLLQAKRSHQTVQVFALAQVDVVGVFQDAGAETSEETLEVSAVHVEEHL
jgi:hypothetical protein